MSRGHLTAVLLVFCLGTLLVSCAGRRKASIAEATPGAQIGVYKGRLVELGGENRRFKLLLFVESPDHLHGEVLSPVGSTMMILDGGDGELAVTMVRDGVSYVGRASPDSLERILGVRISLEELVRAFLSGVSEADCRVTRSAEEQAGLPLSIEFATDEASLSFELKKVRPLRSPPEGLGTGQPPAGTEIRGLQELGAEQRVGDPEAAP